YTPRATLSAQLGGLATQLVFVRRYAAYEHHACCQRPNVLAASRTDRGAIPMRVGVGLPSTVPGATSDTLRAWARDADGGPFSRLGVLDRLVYDSSDPLIALAAAAAVTVRIRLATNIVVGPLRNSTLLSKSAASLHALSGGRFILGLAIGARQEDY